MTATSSSWPWMKGVPVAIADPIPPVCDSDDRPSVKDLIRQHQRDICAVRDELRHEQPRYYDASKHDDLWILRFLLSHKNKIKPSVKAAKATMEFRHRHKLDEQDIRPFPVGKKAKSKAVQRYLEHCTQDALTFAVPHPQRGVLGIFLIASIDQHKLVKHLSEEEWLLAFGYVTEWSHQWLDYVTRTTGRLTKSIRIGDAVGSSLSKISVENYRRDGKAMGAMEDCYPQLLQCIFVCNSPAWVQIPWRVVRPILPKRVAQKIDFVSPKTNEAERSRLLHYVAEEHLPTRYGGKNQVWPLDFAPPSGNCK